MSDCHALAVSHVGAQTVAGSLFRDTRHGIPGSWSRLRRERSPYIACAA